MMMRVTTTRFLLPTEAFFSLLLGDASLNLRGGDDRYQKMREHTCHFEERGGIKLTQPPQPPAHLTSYWNTTSRS